MNAKRGTFGTVVFALAVGIAVVAMVPVGVRAQTPLPRPASGATVTGEVRDVNPLTVRVNGQDQLLQTSPSVVVVREGKDVKLGDLKEGDKVTFTTNPDNTVQRVDVTEAASDSSLWLLIALLILGVLVLIGVVWYLSQRRGRNQPSHRADRESPLSSSH